MTPHEFVLRWRNNIATERQSYQQFFLDLCALIQHPTPRELDAEGKFFTFEAGVTKTTGGQGWADVWYSGHFAIEFKGPDGNLDKAYLQLLQYRESLGNPPLLIVSDTQELLIHTNFTNSVKQITRLTLADLETPDGLKALRSLFYNPESFRPEKTAAQVTEEAATQFAHLAEHLRKWGHSPHAIAHYLIRLLFCLFAEDIDLLPRDLFTRMVETGRRNPAHFNRQIVQLFAAMADGDTFGEHTIRYFDGGLFDNAAVLDMDIDALAILHPVTNLDWSAIEPAILGTLFTRSLDPAKRAQLGAHYTSRDDILLIVEPVLMQPLRREWAEIKERALALANKRDTAPNRAVATRAHNELSAIITAFVQRLATIRVLDPACGSANFLYVSLRLLLELWKQVALFAAELGLPFLSPLPGLAPSPEQLFGIEINDYAHELAQATVWIGYLQWLHENGYGFPSEPILKPLDNIRHMDAILAYVDGKPVEPEWQGADVIVGNPPFLGGNKIRYELGAHYVRDLFDLYQGKVPAFSDLVCYWFERARSQIERGHARRAGLLATNSIRGGVNRIVLERIKETGDIFYAWSNRPWVLEGAAVRVSMVGFDDGTDLSRHLDGGAVGRINADLSPGTPLTFAVQLSENAQLQFEGTKKGAGFEITPHLVQNMLESPNSPGWGHNRQVVKPWINGLDIVRRPRGYWIVDFGTDISLNIASQYVAPFAYVEQRVRPIYEDSRPKWWLHERSRPDMRMALDPLDRYIATARVAKHRIFIWVPGGTLPDSAVVAIARSDDYFFGVLHARPHELWSLRLGTSLEDRPRYTPTTTFETYPFPWPPGREPQDDPRVQAIAAAAKALVAWRDAWLNPPGLPEAELKKRTLTNLYNQRPPELAALHATLDAAVFAAYGWPAQLSDEEILERLLALNLERATKQAI